MFATFLTLTLLTLDSSLDAYTKKDLRLRQKFFKFEKDDSNNDYSRNNSNVNADHDNDGDTVFGPPIDKDVFDVNEIKQEHKVYDPKTLELSHNLNKSRITPPVQTDKELQQVKLPKSPTPPPRREIESLRLDVNVDRKSVHPAHVNPKWTPDLGGHMINVTVNDGLNMAGMGWTPPPDAGEKGLGVLVDESLLNSDQGQRIQAGWKQHQFNQFVSDIISLHRSLPDPRDAECRNIQYRKDLPDTGVVIVFHNEAWSTLLRTVHSVLDRSPEHLLRQIVLVDDFSTLEHLKQPLEDFVFSLEKVKLVRTSAREGLIRARLIGLAQVTSRVVIFLDSHCECAVGWLEPLLDRIADNASTVVVPVIDAIDDKTFQYQFQPAASTNVGTFTWALFFTWMPIPNRERARRTRDIDPITTPTMAGGLFAVDREFFHTLGTYDNGMHIWGGENLELSFRIWMCGGRLETVPCSHVGHVFRGHTPYDYGGLKNPVSVNLARLAAVWLDEYQGYYLQSRHINGPLSDYGDVSERVALRRRLKCHSFAWFLEHIMPDMYVPGDVLAHGPIFNELSGMCLTKWKGNVIGLQPCSPNSKEKPLQWSTNLDEWTIFQGNQCLDYVTDDISVTQLRCHNYGGNQLWEYIPVQKRLMHVMSARCALADEESRLVMAVCDGNNPRQHWFWDTSSLPGPSWRKDKRRRVAP